MFATRAHVSILILSATSFFAAWPASSPAQVLPAESLRADAWPGQCPNPLLLRPPRFIAGEFPAETLASVETCETSATGKSSAANPNPRPADDPLLRQPVAAATPNAAPPSPSAERSVILEHGSRAAVVARARAVVLDVLQNENACSGWLEKSDSHVLDTFSSLRFWVERDGPARIIKEKGDSGDWVEHGPYVAMTSQGTGANTNVALNANGAFFQASSLVSKILWHAGPEVETTTRQPLHVGPFDGGSLEAQTITLIHELAHVVNAIPRDGLTPSGLARSQENTDVIVDRCKRAAKDGAKRVLAAEASSRRSRAAATD